jgi:hypothetical protein
MRVMLALQPLLVVQHFSVTPPVFLPELHGACPPCSTLPVVHNASLELDARAMATLSTMGLLLVLYEFERSRPALRGNIQEANRRAIGLDPTIKGARADHAGVR